jgi:hypothetical protein
VSGCSGKIPSGASLYNTVRASGKSEGSMPTFSLDRILSDRQMALSGAWQRRMSLPEGASLDLRLHNTHVLVQPFPHFSTAQHSSARVSASPRAAASCACRADEKHRCNKPGCGHSEYGVPHAEEPFTTNFDSACRYVEARAQAFAGSALVVSSALASASQSPPM